MNYEREELIHKAQWLIAGRWTITTFIGVVMLLLYPLLPARINMVPVIVGAMLFEYGQNLLLVFTSRYWLRKTTIIVLCYASLFFDIIIISVLHYLTGRVIHADPLLFYIIPIVAAGTALSLRAGVIVSLFSALCLIIASWRIVIEGYSSSIDIWGGFYKGIFLLLFGVVAGYLADQTRRSEVERIETDDRIRLEEQRYRRLLDGAQDYIFELDTGGKFKIANEALIKISGYSQEEMMGFEFRDLVAEDNLREFATNFLHIVEEKEGVKPFSIDIIAKDKRRHTVELKLDPITSRGEVVRIVGIARDRTENA